jgi:hypothetical protein
MLRHGFGAQLDGNLANESYGIDNIELAISSTDTPIVQATEDAAAPINITLALEDNDSSESINSIIMTVPDTVTRLDVFVALFELSIVVTAIFNDNIELAISSTDTPIVQATEDAAAPINITLALEDNDGSEILIAWLDVFVALFEFSIVVTARFNSTSPLKSAFGMTWTRQRRGL